MKTEQSSGSAAARKKINSGFSRNSTDAALTFLLISKVLFHYIVVKMARVLVLLLLH